MFSGGALPFLNDPGFFVLVKAPRLTGLPCSLGFCTALQPTTAQSRCGTTRPASRSSTSRTSPTRDRSTPRAECLFRRLTRRGRGSLRVVRIRRSRCVNFFFLSPPFLRSPDTLGNDFLCFSCRFTLSSRELALVLSQDGMGSGKEWFGGSGRVQSSKWCSVWINQCASNTVLLVTANRVVLAREKVHVDLLCTRGGEKRVSRRKLV
jgi:hypothetical protein